MVLGHPWIGDGDNYLEVAEWLERINPMKEAANLAEYSQGHFPPMALYNSRDNHFHLLVADTSRLVTNGLLGRSKVATLQQVEQVPTNPQGEYQWQKVPASSRSKGGQSSCMTGRGAEDSFSCDECETLLESKGLLDAHKYDHEQKKSQTKTLL